MIKVKVISVYRDKDNPNEIVPLNKELEVSKERYKDLKEYLEVVKETTDKNNHQEIENQ